MVACFTYPDKRIRDYAVALFVCTLVSIVVVTLSSVLLLLLLLYVVVASVRSGEAAVESEQVGARRRHSTAGAAPCQRARTEHSENCRRKVSSYAPVFRALWLDSLW